MSYNPYDVDPSYCYGTEDYYQQQPQQQYYQDDEYYGQQNGYQQGYDQDYGQQQQEYYNADPLSTSSMYSGVEGGVGYDDQQQQFVDDTYMYQDGTTMTTVADGSALMMVQGGAEGVNVNVEPGSYYLDGEIFPQTYDHAVSALAYDKSYNCLYISSTTLPGLTSGLGRGRYNSRGGNYSNSTASSLLMTYSTRRNDTIVNDGTLLDGGTVYSSVAGHPEASPSTLQSLYKAIYGIDKVVPSSSSAALLSASGVGGLGGHHHRRGSPAATAGQPPSHSYRPPYGNGAAHNNLAMTAYPHPQQHHDQQQQQQKGHMGINDLLPLEGTDGYVSSISPSSVRVHSYGGLQVSHNDIEGMVCGTIHPHSIGMAAATHITVGGLHIDQSSTMTTTHNPSQRSRGHSIHCMDLWQGLRTVQSLSFKSMDSRTAAVTALSTSHEKGSMVAGCSDGMIRIISASLHEMATIKSHIGGVSSVAISPDGMLIATTGYSSKAKPMVGSDGAGTAAALYAFPDTTVYVYDIRYLGRGGIPHPFTAVNGAPRHLTFIPNIDGFASNRLLVSSGKSCGGVQIMTPFELQSKSTTSFFLPPLGNNEFITALSAPEEDELAFGTSMGRVMTYRLHTYEKQKSRVGQKTEKTDLLVPPYIPTLPPLSLPPDLLQSDPSLPRNGSSDQQRNIFSSYLLYSDPTLTPIGEAPDGAVPSFGNVAVTPIVEHIKRAVRRDVISKAVVGERDYILTIPMSASGVDVDIFANHNAVSKNYKGKKVQTILANSNKFLYCSKLSTLVYEDSLYSKRKEQQKLRGSGGVGANVVPSRYQQNTRPTFRSSASFDSPDMNTTGLLPGWDYASTLPNAWACPVLLLLYFIPEVRQAALSCQFVDSAQLQKSYDRALTPEVGFIFHQIDCLSRFGILHPTISSRPTAKVKIGTWTPTNFLSFLATMTEAEQLQVLDSSPSAVDHARRPESFYRFLAYQMDKEFEIFDDRYNGSFSKLMDSLHGLTFVSSNQFIESTSTPPTHSSTKALTLDLNYDIFPGGIEKTPIRFGKLLQHSLCRETRLRAWNSASKAYETIVQRKIATSLPPLLTLSCSCAGRKVEDGLWAWRSEIDDEPWLPEFVEIEVKEGGEIVVTEWRNGNQDILVFESKSTLPPEVSKLVASSPEPQKKLYRLEAVVSYICPHDEVNEIDGEVGILGHHVLHSRLSATQKKEILKMQAEEARKLASLQQKNEDKDAASNFVMSASVKTKELEERACELDLLASMCEESDEEASKKYPPTTRQEWILYNGSNVSRTIVEDARAFHVIFKEPVLVMFQAIGNDGKPDRTTTVSGGQVKQNVSIPPSSVKNLPLLSSSVSKNSRATLDKLRAGSPVAFDAEFVAVQEENSILNEAGQKVVVRETRHTVGRVSVLDGQTKSTIIDDHVLPRERVVDYLTRFSGITADDLDPRRTKHRLISTRSAYLQLRYVLEQGCIFVGHGLKQDFSTMNLVVPPHQILDTVELFNVPGMRYVSLRFLTNFVLHRDMQQEIHDSVEDARAAYELFEKARQWKKEGIWDKKLRELYAFGEKTGWKLGVDENP